VTSAPRPGALVLGSDFRALGVVRSLGRRGVPSVLVDSAPRAAWFSRYVRGRARWAGSMRDPGLCDLLLDLARRRGLDGWVLFPMQDDSVELVARHRAALRAAFRVPTPAWPVVRQALDKRLAYSLAAEAGVACPRTWYPGHVRDLARIEVEFPAVLKPACSIALQAAIRRKAFVARSLDELAAQYARAVSLVGSDGLMVQELIPGGGDAQLSVAAYCREGRILVAMTARRSRQYPVDFGLSSSFVEAIELPELFGPTRRLLELMGLSGMVEVEFKRDARDGRDKLLDVNPRAWGWHALCQTCGVDFPYLAYRDALGEPLPEWRVRYGARWRRLLTDLPAALTEVRRGDATALDYLRSFAGRTERSVLDAMDPLPALGDAAVAAWRLARGAR
jgi:predicted ATP-grasp superfamily ATP-dependent carboligase